MSRVTIKDKTFETSIPEAEILERVKLVADRINKDFEGKTPLFLAVLNGSFMYASDLMTHITIPCEISFVKLASYQGVTSTGTIKEIIGLNEDIRDREVIIVEDIVDTGATMKRFEHTLHSCTCINNILYNDNFSITDIFIQTDNLLNRTR